MKSIILIENPPVMKSGRFMFAIINFFRFYFQLLSKMAPLIGKDMSEAIFLERFAALCVDPLFHVRKVCAANFGDFSNVVGSESTEQVLVSYEWLFAFHIFYCRVVNITRILINNSVMYG